MAEGCTREEYDRLMDIKVVGRRRDIAWLQDGEEMQLVRDGNGWYGTHIQHDEDREYGVTEDIDREMVNWYVDEATARKSFADGLDTEQACDDCGRYADPSQLMDYMHVDSTLIERQFVKLCDECAPEEVAP